MSQITYANPICVALDSSDEVVLTQLAQDAGEHVGLFKIGLTAYIELGAPIVEALSATRPVFLDLKLHDIPAQVHGAAAAVAATGAALTTVHASGGVEMMRAAVEGAGDTKVLAVTVLTSLDDASLTRVGLGSDPSTLVMSLADAAMEAGVAGLVCSPLEVADLRTRFGPSTEGGPLLVVPGIRATPGADDQRRTMSAREALDAGADVLVIGRPITASDDPGAAARSLAEELVG